MAEYMTLKLSPLDKTRCIIEAECDCTFELAVGEMGLATIKFSMNCNRFPNCALPTRRVFRMAQDYFDCQMPKGVRL